MAASSRLPERVYWFRRLLVLGTALALVFAIARVLNGSPSADPQSANLNSAPQAPTTSAPVAQGPAGPKAGATAPTTTPTVLVEPDGPCAVEDVTVTPVAGTANAGSTVPLTLQLTGTSPACTFAVTSDSLVAKVTAGSKRIWSSQDCPSAIKSTSVVVRSGTPTTIQVPWSGRYSDATCSRAAGWALPGSYQVAAAAIGSEPSQADLKLTTPPRPVVTKPAKPVKPAATPTKAATKLPTPDSGR